MRGEGYIVTVLQCYWLLTFTFAFACTFVIYAFTLILYICSLIYLRINQHLRIQPGLHRQGLSGYTADELRYRGERDSDLPRAELRARPYAQARHD